jgi:hypothetical protein
MSPLGGDPRAAPHRRLEAVRVHAALEALAGLRRQVEGATGTADGDRIEEGAFQEQVRRALCHLAVLAAHDAGDRHRPLRVGDEERALRQ